jgi:hypothetical protein
MDSGSAMGVLIAASLTAFVAYRAIRWQRTWVKIVLGAVAVPMAASTVW